MKKYGIGFLVLGLMIFGFSASKAEAGLTNAQSQAVINLLNAFNANATTIAAVQNALTSTGNTAPSIPTALPGTTSNTGNTTTTTTTTTNTGNTTTTTTPTNTTPSTGGPLMPPSTPSTPTNGCISTQTAVPAYNSVNGLPCVKSCPVVSSTSNMSYWNVITNSICPVYTMPTSMTVKYPNGGEVFAPGDTVVVKWESQNIPSSNDNVFILLNYYDANGTFIVNSILDDNQMNDNGEEVKLPDTLPTGAMWGAHFKISIGTTNDSGTSLGSDMSDTFFTIE